MDLRQIKVKGDRLARASDADISDAEAKLWL